jgi:hypothetical protein
MGIFDGLQKTEAEQVVEELLTQAPLLAQGEIARAKSSFEMFWGPQDSPRSVDTINDILAILGQEKTIEMFLWHSKWQEWLAIDKRYVPLVPPYDIDFTKDPCVASKKAVIE